MNRPWFRASVLTWYVTLDGKQHTLGKDPRFDAPPKKKPKEPPDVILKVYHALVGRSVEGPRQDQLLSFCMEKYIESLAECTENTLKRSRLFLDGFLASVGDRKVSELRVHHVDAFMIGKRWKQNTRHDVIARINACLNHCVKKGWIDLNPLRGKLELPSIERREEILSPEDQRRLVEAAQGPFKAILTALRETGTRPIELRSALIENCDLEKGILKVQNKTRKKTGITLRPVFLSTKMIELFREQIGLRKSGHIFLNYHRTPWTKSALQHRMEKLCAELKITEGAVLYSMRHGWASDAINTKNINPAMVAIQLGHQNLQQLLKTYLHADTEAMRRALDGD